MKKLIALVVLMLALANCGDPTTFGDNTNQTNDTNTNTQGVCGDGVLNSGYEECDQGTTNSDVRPDACRSNCIWAYCGDGTIDSSEECDHYELSGNTCLTFGYTKGALACDSSCDYDYSSCSLCGNNIAEGTALTQVNYEVCDGTDLRGETCVTVGHAEGVLHCTPGCQYDITGCVGGGPVCGNGIIETGEQCDDGNHNNWDACPDGPGGTCQDATCGDGWVQAGVETCDDGNHLNGDLCPDGIGGTCQDATCGDGHVQIGIEVCDPGKDPLCHPNCQTHCGDGRLQASFGELCEYLGVHNELLCYSDCSGGCGDGITNTSHGEVCDPGTFSQDSATCNYTCTLPSCGDGICNEKAGENRTNCVVDCGTCGDGVCDWHGYSSGLSETLESCPQDCICPIGSPFPWAQLQCGTSCLGFNWWPHQRCCGNDPLFADAVLREGPVTNCGVCGNSCTTGQSCYRGACIIWGG